MLNNPLGLETWVDVQSSWNSRTHSDSGLKVGIRPNGLSGTHSDLGLQSMFRLGVGTRQSAMTHSDSRHENHSQLIRARHTIVDHIVNPLELGLRHLATTSTHSRSGIDSRPRLQHTQGWIGLHVWCRIRLINLTNSRLMVMDSRLISLFKRTECIKLDYEIRLIK